NTNIERPKLVVHKKKESRKESVSTYGFWLVDFMGKIADCTVNDVSMFYIAIQGYPTIPIRPNIASIEAQRKYEKIHWREVEGIDRRSEICNWCSLSQLIAG
ncbi:hypothetical protein WA026_001344, partial [Henosepilachna vigintioctopunctata]